MLYLFLFSQRDAYCNLPYILPIRTFLYMFCLFLSAYLLFCFRSFLYLKFLFTEIVPVLFFNSLCCFKMPVYHFSLQFFVDSFKLHLLKNVSMPLYTVKKEMKWSGDSEILLELFRDTIQYMKIGKAWTSSYSIMHHSVQYLGIPTTLNFLSNNVSFLSDISVGYLRSGFLLGTNFLFPDLIIPFPLLILFFFIYQL